MAAAEHGRRVVVKVGSSFDVLIMASLSSV